MPRAFVGIPVGPAFRDLCVRAREAVVSADPAWEREKWVAPDNLHVTLRFLGDVPGPAIEPLVTALGEELAASAPFRLMLDRPRAVPRARSASLVWVAPSAGGEEVCRLAELVTGASAFLPFEPDGRAFRPHLTLVRARLPRRLGTPAVDALERTFTHDAGRATCVSVRAVTLFGSTLTPRGPVYEELAIIPLGRD